MAPQKQLGLSVSSAALLPPRIHPPWAHCFCPNDLHESYATGTICLSLQEKGRRSGLASESTYTTDGEPQNGPLVRHWIKQNHAHVSAFFASSSFLPRRDWPCRRSTRNRRILDAAATILLPGANGLGMSNISVTPGIARFLKVRVTGPPGHEPVIDVPL